MSKKKIIFILVVIFVCSIITLLCLLPHKNEPKNNEPNTTTNTLPTIEQSDVPIIDIPPQYILDSEKMKENDKHIAITYDEEDENGKYIITDYMYMIPPNEIETPIECDNVWITTDADKNPISAFYSRIAICEKKDIKQLIVEIVNEASENMELPQNKFTIYFLNVATGEIQSINGNIEEQDILTKIQNGYNLTLTRFLDNKTVTIGFIFDTSEETISVEYSVQINYNHGNLTNN